MNKVFPAFLAMIAALALCFPNTSSGSPTPTQTPIYVYPATLPRDFESAPMKAICELGPSFYIKRFVHPKETWIVIVLGRDKKDVAISFTRYPESAEVSLYSVTTPGILEAGSYAITQRGWIISSELTEEERIMFLKNTSFTAEENRKLEECEKKHPNDAAAGSYPESFPKDFENTSDKFTCQTDTERHAYEKHYFVKDYEQYELHYILVLGSNGADTTIFHQNTTRDVIRVGAYTAGKDGWELDGALTAGFTINERGEVQRIQNYTEEEWQQMKTCLLQKIEEAKKAIQ